MTSAAASTAYSMPVAFFDLDEELAGTRRLLESYPDGHGEWAPHEKSMTLARLASHIAELPYLARIIIETEGWDAAANPYTPVVAETRAEIVASFDGAAGALRAALAAAGPEALERPWAMRAGDRVFFSGPKGALVRQMGITHLAHHRGQFTVYLRMLGVPVPGLYGPSADES